MAVPYATVDDVQERLGRELTDEERALATVLLKDAENRIRVRVPNLDARVAASTTYADLVVRVEADAVNRVLRNPDGYSQESDGSYSYSIRAAVAAGYLLITDEEWADLLGRSTNRGAFTVAPKLRTPRRGLPRRGGGWWP